MRIRSKTSAREPRVLSAASVALSSALLVAAAAHGQVSPDLRLHDDPVRTPSIEIGRDFGVGDINGDGSADVVTYVLASPPLVTTYLGRTDGGFDVATVFEIPDFITVYPVRVDDLNGDGNADAVFVGQRGTGSALAVLLMLLAGSLVLALLRRVDLDAILGRR